MRLKKPATENERLLASALLMVVIFFGLNSLISIYLEVFKDIMEK